MNEHEMTLGKERQQKRRQEIKCTNVKEIQKQRKFKGRLSTYREVKKQDMT